MLSRLLRRRTLRRARRRVMRRRLRRLPMRMFDRRGYTPAPLRGRAW